MEKIKLNTKLNMISNSQKTGIVYTAILHKSVLSPDKLVVTILDERGLKTPLSCRVEDMAKNPSDIIYIDIGQKWAVNNVRELIGEILVTVLNTDMETI